MKLVINRIVMAILIACFISACGKKEAPVPAAGTEEKLFFKIQFIIGDVKISGVSGSREAKAGENININESIITGKKSAVDVIFGASGVIRINENSRVAIKSIADKNTGDTVMDMDKGKVFITLAKLKGKSFRVKTPTAVASVRGTSFTVVSDNKGAKLSVANGTVAVNPVKDGKIFEDKTASVEAGKKTGYIDKKSVEKIIEGKMEIPVMDMTPAEKIEIQSEVKNIKIEAIPDLSMELKEEIKQQIEISAVPGIKESRKESSIKKDEREDILKKVEEEKKIREAELKKLAEEKKQLEEKKKKDRASNIPTL
jgi:hypothetical protein